MRSLTIGQRLITAQTLLVGLLVTGIGLVFWMQAARLGADYQREKLQGTKDRIGCDFLVITDTLRGLAADPRNEADKTRCTQARHTLESRLGEAQEENRAYPELEAALKSIGDFALGSSPGTLGAFQEKVLQMAESDPANALSYYNSSAAATGRQRDQLLKDLSQQIDQVSRTHSSRARTISTACLFGLALVLLASVLVGRLQVLAVSEPLQRVIATLEALKQGDLTPRLNLDQKDELGTLSRGVNHLADDLCELVGQVQSSGVRVNSNALQIAATAKEQQATAHEIATTTGRLGTTSKQISSTSRELVKTMSEVNQVAEQTANLAGTGQAAITRMEATMRQILEACSSISAKFAALSEKTTNINTVVSTITKVADQTNLLSLNAAIEAEKAGEYGLGFTVVAMEIRRLADQTAVATYDIEKTVKEMQSAVSAGVTSMERFSADVSRGVDGVHEVSAQLGQIMRQVQTLSARFQLVNDGMSAQATGAHQISEQLTQLSEAAQQTAQSLKTSNLAIEQLNGAVLSLQNSVARFRLSPRPGQARDKSVGSL